jgi:hypothetical protein
MGRSSDSSDLILKTPDEVEKSPQGIVRRWVAELSMADETEKDWRKEASDIWGIYESEKQKANSFNILWSNTEILTASVYNSTPKPDVRRRFRDKDPVGKSVSLVLERALDYEIDDYDFDASISDAVLDAMLTGRGLIRIKYDPKFAPAVAQAASYTDSPSEQQKPATGAASGDPGEAAPQEQMAPEERLVDEMVECEHVSWDKFRRGPGRRWPDVPWIAFEHDFTFEMALEKFGEAIATELEYLQGEGTEHLNKTESDKETRSIFKTCKIQEIWDRGKRRVLFISPTYKEQPCLIAEDPLHLKGFWPLPRPVYAIANSRSLLPTPPYRLYKQQAKELDRISARINEIAEHLRVRGLYASQLPEIAGVLEAGNGVMSPVQNAAEIAAMGGLDKAIWLMPIDRLKAALDSLYLARNEIKQTIYEIMGIGDILRGASDARETAAAQEIKSKWGSLRIQKIQREIQRMVRDVIRLKAEVIAERFSQRTLATITNVQLPDVRQKMMAQQAAMQAKQSGQPIPPELQKILSTPSWDDVMGVLRSDSLRQCRVDIETDSTVAETINRDMQGLSEIATSVGGILAAVAQGLPMDTAKEFALAIVRRARLGNAVEDALESMEQPKQAPDPEMQKQLQELQQENQQLKADSAAEMKKAQDKAAIDQQSAQHDAELKHSQAQTSAQLELDKANHQAQLDERKALFEQELAERKALFEMQLKQKESEMMMAIKNFEAEHGAELSERAAKTEGSEKKEGQDLSALIDPLAKAIGQLSASKEVVRNGNGNYTVKLS